MGGRHWHLPGWKPEMVLNILLCVELPGPGCQQCQLWVRAPALVTECVLKKGGCGGGGARGLPAEQECDVPNNCLLCVCRPHGNRERPPRTRKFQRVAALRWVGMGVLEKWDLTGP